MGREAKLAFQGHVLMENRNGLVAEARLTPSNGKAESEAALKMVEAQAGGSHPTLAGDKAYDTREFVASVRALGVTPLVAQNTVTLAAAAYNLLRIGTLAGVPG